MGYAFISYSTANQSAADSLRALFAKNGIPTWMAPYDIPVGSHYAQVISNALKGCACLVLVLTNQAQDSIWVAKEVERAIHYRKPIMPLQLGEVALNDEFELYISTDQILPVKRIDESGEDIRRILAAVKACTGQEAAPVTVTSAQITFDTANLRTFASCGKEGSVFKVSHDAPEVAAVQVNFEPTRLRSQIPDFAGIYWLKQPALDIRDCKCIRFRARSRDGGIGSLCVELKPEGKAWMHERFECTLTADWQEFSIDTAAFRMAKTLSCLEEITFVLRPEDFTNEEQLTGQLELADIVIE